MPLSGPSDPVATETAVHGSDFQSLIPKFYNNIKQKERVLSVFCSG